jgi:hypothetical protein
MENSNSSEGIKKVNSEEDYVFRFKLDPPEAPSDPDLVLVNFFRSQLRDLFKIVFFSKKGEKIIPDEFGFLNDQDIKYPLHEQSGLQQNPETSTPIADSPLMSK